MRELKVIITTDLRKRYVEHSWSRCSFAMKFIKSQSQKHRYTSFRLIDDSFEVSAAVSVVLSTDSSRFFICLVC